MPTWSLGKDAKIYQGTAGGELDTLTEMSNVKDVTLSMEAGETDVTTRANSGWRATASTLKEATCEFEMIWDPTDTGFAAILDAFLTGKTIELAPLTGARDAVGSQGLKGAYAITQCNRNEPLEEAITASVTAKLAVFSEWVEVEAPEEGGGQ